MAELERLKRRRVAAKSWASRAANSLADLLDQKEEVAGVNFGLVVAEAVQECQGRLAAYDEAQSQVEVELDADTLEADLAASWDFRGRIRRVLLRAEGVRQQQQQQNGDHHSASSVGNQSVKLPKLELPTFSGDVLEWAAFWEAFEAAVDRTELPEVNKLTYLRSLLRGEAKRCVEGLPLSGSSYRATRELLQERFGRRELIIFTHVQKLLDVGSSGRQGLQHLVDELLIQVRSLEGLGIRGDQYGVLLTPLLLSRLPSSVRLEWARCAEGKEGDLSFLISFLQREILRLERSGVYEELAPEVGRPRPASVAGRRALPAPARTSGAALQVTTHSCCFCNQQGHSADKCGEVFKLTRDQRFQAVLAKGLCFCCLKRGHLARWCSARCDDCGGRHHCLLCMGGGSQDSQGGGSRSQDSPRGGSQSQGSPGADGPGGGGVPVGAGVGLSCSTGGVTLLPVATVKVESRCGTPVQATLIFDSGADRSFVTRDLMKKVKGNFIGSLELTCASFGGTKKTDMCNMYDISVSAARMPLSPAEKLTVVEVESISAPLRRPPVPADLLQPFNHLQLATEHSPSNDVMKVDIVIGQDQYWKLVRSGLVRSGGLVAMETAFGYVMSGAVEGRSGGADCGLSLLTMVVPHSSCEMWADMSSEDSKCEDSLLKEFNEVIEFNQDRYTVSIPWNENKALLQDNRVAAEKRLVSTERRLAREPLLRDEYDAALQQMEADGVVKEVPPDQLKTGNVTFYMPHRPVVKPTSTTTKVRPVFDASAKGPNGISLNDAVYVGPSLMPSVQEVLLRFRRWRFGISGDIKRAFHQIRLKEADRDAHRFLWRQDGRMKVMRFDRVVMGVACSSFLLNATIRYHVAQYDDSRVKTELTECLYVDDWLSGADTVQEAAVLLQEARSVMADAGMELTKCSSNSSLLLDSVRQPQALTESESVKVLGVTWCQEDDTLCFTGDHLPAGVIPTKRLVLCLLARIYDPLGLLTPFTALAKCLFQELWEQKLDWDEALADNEAELFGRWLDGCQQLQDMKVPRCFTALSDTNWTSLTGTELHVFADASPKAYGACVYLRFMQTDGTFCVSFVMSKGRVAPLRQRLTLPRLELMACLMAAELVKFVCKALHLPEDTPYTCWSDSMIALGWLRGRPERWNVFVRNRVSQIQQLTSAVNWRHCRSEDNPADLLTRGLFAEQLMTSAWFGGPAWLAQPELPTAEEDDVSPDPLPEAAGPAAVPAEVGALTVSVEVSNGRDFLQIERHGTLSKATRVVGWVLRFINNARNSSQRRNGELTTVELAAAHDQLYKSVQNDSFSAEMQLLRAGKPVPASSPIHRLTPFLGEDGLIRVRGRLQMSDLCYEEKHPVILPRGYLAELLVREQHRVMKHCGVSTLMTAVRSSLWIVGLRTIARRVVRGCVSCRRHDSRPCCEPSPPLPRDRVTEARAFDVCALDFAGPLFSADSPAQKLYVCLFTCSVVRAVHLEMTESMNVDDFLLAFQRFAARRGLPSVVYCDNFRTFKCAERLLQSRYGRLAPQFKFSAPLAPWWGGQFERMVRTVKSALKKSLGQRYLSKAELQTILVEIEACVNSRPLTFVGDTPDDPLPLTPAHFLTGHSAGFQARTAEEPLAVTAESLRARAKVRERRLRKFWQVWRSDYLRGLPLSVRQFTQQGKLTEGSVVLVRDENQPRQKWEMGVVTKLFPGRDGVPRSAEVRTARGRKTRAVQRLHDLEVLNPRPS